MLRKASNATLAASISSATVSPSVAVATTPVIVTYTTVDPHNLYVGARVTITGLTSTDANSPNVTRVLVYKLDGPNKFSVILPTTTVYATAPTISLTGGAGVYGTMTSVNPALSASKVRYSQPVVVDRPTFYNYIYPTITATPTGTGVSLVWEAIGVAFPSLVIYSLERVTGTNSSVVLSSLAKGTYLDSNVATSGSATTLKYRISAANANSTNVTTATAVSLYIANISAITAIPVNNAENAITITWTAPTTNATITSYELQRLDITTTSPVPSWSSLVPESGPIPPSQTTYTDLNAVDAISYIYRVRAVAFYATGGSVTSNYITSSSVTAYYTDTPASITAVPVAGVANRINISWSTVVADPAVTTYELQQAREADSYIGPSIAYDSYVTVQNTIATSFAQVSAQSGRAYLYRVRAISPAITGNYVTTTSPVYAYHLVDPLPAPTLAKTVNSTTNTSIIVSGIIGTSAQIAIPAITGYNIRRSSDNGANWSNIGATNFSITLPYTDTTVSTNTSYIYSVKAQSAQLTTANWSANAGPIVSNAVQKATGGDIINSYVSGGTTYFAHVFLQSGTFQPLVTNLAGNFMQMGGGGGGGGGKNGVGGGGGGAGGYDTAGYNLGTSLNAVPVTVGVGGTGVLSGASNNGQSSGTSLMAFSPGGGRGTTTSGSSAASGGGGGGGGNGANAGAAAGTGGLAGGSGAGNLTSGAGGGGGGSFGGSAGGNAPNATTGGAGGAGTTNNYATGVNQTYGVGGGGGGTASGEGATSTAYGSGGGGSSGNDTSGQNGVNGIVIIRYPI